MLGTGRGDTALFHLGLPPMPVAEFFERTTQLQTYLAGGTIDIDGRDSRIRWLDSAKAGKVPLDIAASGPKVIDFSARTAERITFALGADPDRLAWGIELARAAAADAGRDPADLTFGSYVSIGCHPDLDAARAMVHGSVAAFAHFSSMPGSTGAGLAERGPRHRRRGRPAATTATSTCATTPRTPPRSRASSSTGSPSPARPIGSIERLAGTRRARHRPLRRHRPRLRRRSRRRPYLDRTAHHRSPPRPRHLTPHGMCDRDRPVDSRDVSHAGQSPSRRRVADYVRAMSAGTEPPAIRTEGLTKRFGDFVALDDLTLDVAEGEVFGFLGPNGAGKSTTLRLLLGLIKPTAGRAEIKGIDVARTTDVHGHLAYVPGDVSLWPRLTGEECLELFARLQGGVDEAYRAELVERFELDLSKRARAYSKGNRQKVALVAAFARRPDVLLLDEPTSGLDPLMEQQFRRCVHEASERGPDDLPVVAHPVGGRGAVRPRRHPPRRQARRGVVGRRAPPDAHDRVGDRLRRRAARPRSRSTASSRWSAHRTACA